MFIILVKELSSNRNAGLIIVLLSLSSFMYWEIMTRSDIFTYSLLVLLVLEILPSLHREKLDLKFFIVAFLTGFLLSTRIVFVLIYMVFFFSALVNKEMEVKRFIIFVLTAFLAFAITILPLVLIFKNDFFVINPFMIQSSYLTTGIFIFVIILSVLFGLIIKNQMAKYFYGGLILFSTILLYSISLILRYGYSDAFEGSIIDVSYFIFCVPFLIYYLLKNTKPASALY